MPRGSYRLQPAWLRPLPTPSERPSAAPAPGRPGCGSGAALRSFRASLLRTFPDASCFQKSCHGWTEAPSRARGETEAPARSEMGGPGLEPGTSCLPGITAEVTAVFGLSAGALTPVHQPGASPATRDPHLPSGNATSSDVRPTRGPLPQLARSDRRSRSAAGYGLCLGARAASCVSVRCADRRRAVIRGRLRSRRSGCFGGGDAPRGSPIAAGVATPRRPRRRAAPHRRGNAEPPPRPPKGRTASPGSRPRRAARSARARGVRRLGG
jgi:hypothetical protein